MKEVTEVGKRKIKEFLIAKHKMFSVTPPSDYYIDSAAEILNLRMSKGKPPLVAIGGEFTLSGVDEHLVVGDSGITLTEEVSEALTLIAQQELSVMTLEAQNSDSKDFHDIGVAMLKKALEQAFLAGIQYAESGAV